MKTFFFSRNYLRVWPACTSRVTVKDEISVNKIYGIFSSY